VRDALGIRPHPPLRGEGRDHEFRRSAALTGPAAEVASLTGLRPSPVRGGGKPVREALGIGPSPSPPQGGGGQFRRKSQTSNPLSQKSNFSPPSGGKYSSSLEENYICPRFSTKNAEISKKIEDFLRYNFLREKGVRRSASCSKGFTRLTRKSLRQALRVYSRVLEDFSKTYYSVNLQIILNIQSTIICYMLVLTFEKNPNSQ